MSSDILSPLHTFIYGFVACGFFFVQSLWGHRKTKKQLEVELARYKAIHSNKTELDSQLWQDLKKEIAELKQANENLRTKIVHLNERPNNKLTRDLEILTRAEKQMVISAPGFAPAWELAKSAALGQLKIEDTGGLSPQRIYKMLFGSSSSHTNVALPESAAAAAKNGQDTTSAA